MIGVIETNKLDTMMKNSIRKNHPAAMLETEAKEMNPVETVTVSATPCN